MILGYLIFVWWTSVVGFILLDSYADKYILKYRGGVRGLYGDNIPMGCLLMIFIGPLNFVCFPLWLYYEQRRYRLDAMIRELQS